MEFAVSLTMAGLSVIAQTIIIVMLYNHYIIPQIVEKVQERILTQMGIWVESVKVDVSDNVTTQLNSRMDEATTSIKRAIAGKRGKNQRILALAEDYLDSNLSDDMDEDKEDSIIAEAITSYGADIVNSILERRRKEKRAQPTVSSPDAPVLNW